MLAIVIQKVAMYSALAILQMYNQLYSMARTQHRYMYENHAFTIYRRNISSVARYLLGTHEKRICIAI